MKLKTFRGLSTCLIVFMLICLVGYIGTSSYQYAFSYQNEDIIYNGNRDSNKISLMINVYWGTEYILDMLDILDKYDVKCTFFVGGQWVEKEPQILICILCKVSEKKQQKEDKRDCKQMPDVRQMCGTLPCWC